MQPVAKVEWFVACYLAWDYDAVTSKKADPGPGEIIKVKSGSLAEVTKTLTDANYEGFLPKRIKNVKIIEELLNVEEFSGTTE